AQVDPELFKQLVEFLLMPALDRKSGLAKATLDQRLTLGDFNETVGDLRVLQHHDRDLTGDDGFEGFVQKAAEFERLGRGQAAVGARVEERLDALERIIRPARADLVDIERVKALARRAIVEALGDLIELAERDDIGLQRVDHDLEDIHEIQARRDLAKIIDKQAVL